MNKEKVLAIDIGGTGIKVAVVDKHGKIEPLFTEKTHFFKEIDEIPIYIQKKLKNSSDELGLIGIGIGAPNGNSLTGCIEFAPNLPWKGKIPIVEKFENHFSLKTKLANDANAAALGEKLFGTEGDKTNFVFITLGTGLGSGIVIDGQLVTGHDGLAGELGHMILIPNGRNCGCGRKGCVETYCSSTGLVTTYVEKCKDKKLTDITSEEIYFKAMKGEIEALETFNYTGYLLGLTLANCVTFSSPKTFFLFGGLTKAKELLLNPTIKSFSENILEIYKNKIEILTSTLPDNKAAFLGAASLIFNEI